MGTGSNRRDHLGVTRYTGAMEFTATEDKVKKIRMMARNMIQEVRAGRRWVNRSKLTSFCGVEVSMM